MSFPEGRKDWFMIITFVISVLRTIGDLFFGDNPGGEKSDSK